MPTNDFLPFAVDVNAGVMSQADYAERAGLGVVPGIADPDFANKAWRQAANMAAAIGQLMSDGGYDARDNGDIASLKNNLSNALSISKKYDIVTTNDVSVPSDTDTNISSYTFARTGVYIVFYSLSFRSSNSNGIRQLVVSETSGGSFIDNSALFVSNAATTGFSFAQLGRIEKITSDNTTRYLVANQNSGSTMNVRGTITVMRAGDV